MNNALMKIKNLRYHHKELVKKYWENNANFNQTNNTQYQQSCWQIECFLLQWE